jgi:hypothetical protein
MQRDDTMVNERLRFSDSFAGGGSYPSAPPPVIGGLAVLHRLALNIGFNTGEPVGTALPGVAKPKTPPAKLLWGDNVIDARRMRPSSVGTRNAGFSFMRAATYRRAGRASRGS